MNRRTVRGRGAAFAWAIVILGTLGCADDEADSPPRPPNLLLISLDTLRADALGCYGNQRALTPVLDALAARGLRFERAYSPSPWTLPAHATMFTGLEPGRHGVLGDRARLASSLPTLAERLLDAGYRTGAFTGAGYMHEGFGLLRGFEDVDCRGGSLAQIAPRASHWLIPKERSWFLFLHCYDAHTATAGTLPYASDDDLRRRFVRAIPQSMMGRAEVLERMMLHGSAPAEEVDVLRGLYDAAVATMDRRLGAWLDWAEREGHLENTYVCVVSDHGEGFFEHGFVGHSSALYDEMLHVPWIVAGPGIEPGVVRDAVGLRDLAPTLLSLLGLEPLEVADGLALVSPEGSTPPPADRILSARMDDRDVAWVQSMRERGWDPSLQAIAVRRGERKRIQWLDSEESQEFDLVGDPAELTPLADTAAGGAPDAAAEGASLVEAIQRLRTTRPIAEPGVGPGLAELLRELGYAR